MFAVRSNQSRVVNRLSTYTTFVQLNRCVRAIITYVTFARRYLQPCGLELYDSCMEIINSFLCYLEQNL